MDHNELDDTGRIVVRKKGPTMFREELEVQLRQTLLGRGSSIGIIGSLH